ncbi:MAG TPA: hypothetical protein VEH07_02295 [Alphaproteobacteria bacterium]|nr:hypothetical protein [Alphaproteobacteria bacterium]
MAVTGFYALAVIGVVGVVGPALQRLICGGTAKQTSAAARAAYEPRPAMSAHSSSTDKQANRQAK